MKNLPASQARARDVDTLRIALVGAPLVRAALARVLTYALKQHPDALVALKQLRTIGLELPPPPAPPPPQTIFGDLADRLDADRERRAIDAAEGGAE